MILKRPSRARERFKNDWKGKTPGSEAAVERYLAETDRNTQEALELAQANPTFRGCRGPRVRDQGGQGRDQETIPYQAIELRQRPCARSGHGPVCGQIFHFVHVPVAEALIRAVLKENPTVIEARPAIPGDLPDAPGQDGRGFASNQRRSTDTFLSGTRRQRRVREGSGPGRPGPHPRRCSNGSLRSSPTSRTGTSSGRSAHRRGRAFALRHLAVGKIAPEIVGRDHEGKPFALERLPGQGRRAHVLRQLVRPLRGHVSPGARAGRPPRGQAVCLLSVNTDASVETLRKSIAKGEITWRCWWDGGMPADHDAVGRRLIPVDLRPGQGGRDPLQGCTGRGSRPGGHVPAQRGGEQETLKLIRRSGKTDDR